MSNTSEVSDSSISHSPRVSIGPGNASRRPSMYPATHCARRLPSRREEKEETCRLSPAHRQFFERALRYARETVRDRSGSAQRQRVRWWSALALLRALASSPAAAASGATNTRIALCW